MSGQEESATAGSGTYVAVGLFVEQDGTVHRGPMCPTCGALVLSVPTHDAWHVALAISADSVEPS